MHSSDETASAPDQAEVTDEHHAELAEEVLAADDTGMIAHAIMVVEDVERETTA